MAEDGSDLSGPGPSSADILVVGGGIMGLWGAVKAADAGFSVLLIDAGTIGSGASGGLLGALFPWMPDRWDAKKQYQFDALVSLPGEIARLERATGLSANFRRSGRIVPLPKPHLVDIARRHERDARENWRQNGAEFFWHLRDGAPDGDYVDPAVSAAGHVFDTLAARVEPRALLRLLRTWLAQQPNVRIVEHARLDALDANRGRAEISFAKPAPSLRTSPSQEAGESHVDSGRGETLAPSSPQRGEGGPQGRMRGSRSARSVPQDPLIASHTLGTSPRRGEEGVRSTAGVPYAIRLPLEEDMTGRPDGYPDTHTVTFSHAFIAAGAESFPILRRMMPRLPKPLGQGVKGQAALIRAHLDPALPVVFLDGVYVVPHEGGLVAVGSTSENHFSDPASTDAGLDAVIEKARALIPALRDAPVVERWAGIRPKAIGRDPMVGPVPGHPTVIALTGGFKISFGMAHRLADSAMDEVLGYASAPLPENFTIEGQLLREMAGARY